MPMTGMNYIAGSTSAEGAETFFSVDPRNKTRDDLPFHNATRAEVGRAVDAAVSAFKEMRKLSLEQDCRFSRRNRFADRGAGR